MQQQWTKSKNRLPFIHILLKVTTCLYLSPSNKARSLSTLIAVNVNKDAGPKIKPDNLAAQFA